MFKSAIAGWLFRRVFDWGGWLGTFILGVVAFYNALPPASQGLLSRVFEGNWQDITIGAIVPFIVLIFSQVASFRATVKDQVVADGKKVALPELPHTTQTEVKQKVETVTARKPTILESLAKAFGRRS